MYEASFTGGAIIGWINATWPLARLDVTAHRLKLSCAGTYEFRPDQIVALEKTDAAIGSGLHIVHNRLDYPEDIVFRSGLRDETILLRIKATGFHPSGQAVVRPSDAAVKSSVLLLAFAIWNGCFFADWAAHDFRHRGLGPLSFFMILCALVIVIALPHSESLQRFALKPGRDVGELKAWLALLRVVLGIGTLAMALSLLFESH